MLILQLPNRLAVRLSYAMVLTSLLTLVFGYPQPVSGQSSYTPPAQVTVWMYELSPNGQSTGQLCLSGEQEYRYGCTVYGLQEIRDITPESEWRRYPFDQTQMTVQIDGPTIGSVNPNDNPYDPEQRYLWDVVATEYGIQLGSQDNKLLSGVKAQAIAARTYIYQRILNNYPIDNSNAYQVFTPFAFQVWPRQDAQKQRLLEAVQARLYMSMPGSEEPIEAFYGADNRGLTSQGPHSYVAPVSDPISEPYGCGIYDQNGLIGYGTNESCGTGFGGLSSKGAARWSFGHTSSIGPVAESDSRYPHDLNGLGDFWSVHWGDAFQILTHYYTGIHIRDANNGNQILTPVDRWAPLRITANGRPLGTVCAGSRLLQLTVWFQNTSTRPWLYGYPIVLREHSDTVSAVEQAALTQPTADLQPGDTFTATLSLLTIPTVAEPAHDFYLDMLDFQSGQWFSGQTPSWPRYRLTLPIVACSQAVYLPLVQGDATATTLSE